SYCLVIHLLLLDQIQQTFQWACLARVLYFVGHLLRGRFHSFLLRLFRAATRHLVSRRRHMFTDFPLSHPCSCSSVPDPHPCMHQSSLMGVSDSGVHQANLFCTANECEKISR